MISYLFGNLLFIYLVKGQREGGNLEYWGKCYFIIYHMCKMWNIASYFETSLKAYQISGKPLQNPHCY